MRRRFAGLAALLLVGLTVGMAPAGANVPSASHFDVFVVVGEGPPPPPGSTAEFSTQLLDAHQVPIAGAPVTIETRPFGSDSYSPVGQTTTGADGRADERLVIRRTSAVRWHFAGDADHVATTSASVVSSVGSPVTARVLDASLRRHQKVVVSGRTAKVKAGRQVSLWRGDKPAFAPGVQMTRVAVGVVRPDGTFRLTARFAHPGAKRLFVQVSPGGGYAVGYSRYLRLRVR